MQANGVIVASGRLTVTPCGNLDLDWLRLNELLLKPWHLGCWSWYVSVAADVLGEVVVGGVVQGQAGRQGEGGRHHLKIIS